MSNTSTTKIAKLAMALAAMLIITMNCSCSRTDSNDRLEDMLEYVGDNATLIATADVTLLTGATADESGTKHGQPIMPVKVISNFCPVVEDIVSSLHDYKGLDLNCAVAVSYSLSLPDETFAIIIPVTDKSLAERSFKSRSFTPSRATNGEQVFRRQSLNGLAIVMHDDYAWFVADTEPSLLVKHVQDIEAKGKDSKIADWKRDLLLSGNAATVLVNHKVGNLDGEYLAVTFTAEDDEDFALNGRVLDSKGEVTTFDKPENFRYIDHEAMSKLSGNSLVCAAFAMPKGTSGRRIADAFLDNPEHSDAETDSLRSIITHLVDNIDGTMALSLSFNGEELYDIEAYRLDYVCKMLKGTANGSVNSIGRFAKMLGVPATSTGSGTVTYDFAGLTIKLSSDSDGYLTLNASNPGSASSAKPHPIDSENLIGYAVIDLPSNSPLVKALGNEMRLQMQMRITPSGFNINLSANDEAAELLTSLSSLTSIPFLLTSALLI